VSKTLTETLRRTDLAFRNGGDEFVVLLPQTPLNSALAAMEKVRRSLSLGSPTGHAAPLPSPTLSIGVAELWRGCAAPELLRAADSALYRAKRESRNCVRAHAVAA
jgi:diguanylate cyclase (GGDEF)-like protein